jgi:hypothetical protein
MSLLDAYRVGEVTRIALISSLAPISATGFDETVGGQPDDPTFRSAMREADLVVGSLTMSNMPGRPLGREDLQMSCAPLRKHRLQVLLLVPRAKLHNTGEAVAIAYKREEMENIERANCCCE